MIFLVNPSDGTRRKSGKRRKARSKSRRKPTAAQLRARAAFVARFGNAGTGEGVKARRASTETQQRRSQGGTMAQRKRSKRRRSVRRNPAKAAASKRKTHRRKYHQVSAHKRKGTKVRSYWQNPQRRRRRRHTGFGFRRNPGGVVGQVIGAAKDVAAVVVGKAATNYVSRMIPFGNTSKAITAGKKLAIAIGLSMVAKRVANQRVADLILVGGILGPVEDFASTLPVIGTALASDTTVSTTAALGAYIAGPMLPPVDAGSARMSKIGVPGMGSYPGPRLVANGGMPG